MNFHATAGAPSNTARRRSAAARRTFQVNGHPAKQRRAARRSLLRRRRQRRSRTSRNYKAADIQIDVKLNKAGWHFPQPRIIALWERRADNLLGRQRKPPEPFFFRANSGECIEYLAHQPGAQQVRASTTSRCARPTDILGQHIHLVKFDVTSSDGGGNGWNYEDGSFGRRGGAGAHRRHPPAQRLLRRRPTTRQRHADSHARCAKVHPVLRRRPGRGLRRHDDFLGAQTTVQRWWADPITNTRRQDRTLRTVFTHDHFGPSTHQQAGLYAGLIVEPAGSTWFHNETGVQLGTNSGTGLTTTAAPPAGRR